MFRVLHFCVKSNNTHFFCTLKKIYENQVKKSGRFPPELRPFIKDDKSRCHKTNECCPPYYVTFKKWWLICLVGIPFCCKSIPATSETRQQWRTKCTKSLGCAEIESMPTRACNIRKSIALPSKHGRVHNYFFFQFQRIKYAEIANPISICYFY